MRPHVVHVLLLLAHRAASLQRTLLRQPRCGRPLRAAKRERPRQPGLSSAAKVSAPLFGAAGGLMLVDGDNVRGKGDWLWSAADFVHEVDSSAARRMNATAVLFLDHGEERDVVMLRPDFALAFAGPHRTADDAIVDAIAILGDAQPIRLVTSDFGLRERVAHLPHVDFVSSLALLDDLRAHRTNVAERPWFAETFSASYSDLAGHVCRARTGAMTQRDREIAAARRFNASPVIPREKTWMRALLNERLRLLVRRRGADAAPALAAFAKHASAPEHIDDRRLLAQRFEGHATHLAELSSFGEYLATGRTATPAGKLVPAASATFRQSRRRRRGTDAVDAPQPAKPAPVDHAALDAVLGKWLGKGCDDEAERAP